MFDTVFSIIRFAIIAAIFALTIRLDRRMYRERYYQGLQEAFKDLEDSREWQAVEKYFEVYSTDKEGLLWDLRCVIKRKIVQGL